jgi:hemin uptake protein HemP
MKNRCYNKNGEDYPEYGAKGIKVCDRWRKSFENFFADMGKRPSKTHSIDRYPNKKGNYNPSNCRWATKKEQSRNLKSNKYFLYNGEMIILKDLAEILKTHPSNINRMLLSKSIVETIEYYELRNIKNKKCKTGKNNPIRAINPDSIMQKAKRAGIDHHLVGYHMRKHNISAEAAISKILA